jgi:archaellum component FlaC
MDDLTPANVAILINSMNQLSSNVNQRMDSFEKTVGDQIGNLVTAFHQANNGHRESIKELYQENKDIRSEQSNIRLEFTKQITEALAPIRTDLQGLKTEVAEIKAVKATEDVAEVKKDNAVGEVVGATVDKSRFRITIIVGVVSVILGALLTVLFTNWLSTQNDANKEKTKTEKVEK